VNSYSQHLVDAVAEIRAFASSDAGRACDSRWYEQIESLVGKVCAQTTDEEAERYLDTLMWRIVDSGPLDQNFAPSIDRAADAMQRKRKRGFKRGDRLGDDGVV
jgi:hypothetical protein